MYVLHVRCFWCHLGIAFIDVQQPASLRALSPDNPTPLTLVHSSRTVSGPENILEYLDGEWQQQTTLILPAKPYEKSRVRAVCDVITKRVIANYYTARSCQSPSEAKSAVVKMLQGILQVFSLTTEDDGCFLMGDKLGLADILLAPFAQRICVALKSQLHLNVPTCSKFEPFWSWWNSMQTQDCYVKSAMTDENLLNLHDKLNRFEN